MKCLVFFCMIAVSCLAASTRQTGGRNVFTPPAPGSLKIQGFPGERIADCGQKRIWDFETDKIVAQLLDHKDSGGWGNWRGEYWGKWQTAAAWAYEWEPSEEKLARLKGAATEVLKGQAPDGYLGPHNPEHRLEGWDVWCRKYVLLGLLTTYDLTGDKRYLEAASRNLDNLITDVERRQIKLVETGVPELQGTANCSILEPIAILYRHTGQPRYLGFAESIIDQWSRPSKLAPQGLLLMENAVAGRPPLRNHAYAIQSCFEGICEMYRATGNRKYLHAAVRFGHTVREHERMINGSVSNQELFCGGARNQTELLEQPQETCATATWMKLCTQLLRLTGDPVWADELELSLYNAMLGSMAPGGEWFAYFTPLTGERVPSFLHQQDVELSCCVMSGPRGVMTVPQWAVMGSKDGPVVNLFARGSARIALTQGVTVSVRQETEYPVTGSVKLTVSPDREQRFVVQIRIPAWSTNTTLTVNSESVRCTPGSYARLDREWKTGDEVLLTLDMGGRVVPAPSGAPQLAIMHGPVLLALDNRLTPTLDAPVRLKSLEGLVEMAPAAFKPDWAWMAFAVPFEVRPAHFFGHYTTNLALCDYASAGNAWSETNLFRSWLPQPLFLPYAFPANTWKMLQPGQGRPSIPGSARKAKAGG